MNERKQELQGKLLDLMSEYADVLCPPEWSDGEPIETPACVNVVAITQWMDLSEMEDEDTTHFIRYITGPGGNSLTAIALCTTGLDIARGIT